MIRHIVQDSQGIDMNIKKDEVEKGQGGVDGCGQCCRKKCVCGGGGYDQIAVDESMNSQSE